MIFYECRQVPPLLAGPKISMSFISDQEVPAAPLPKDTKKYKLKGSLQSMTKGDDNCYT